MLQVWKAWVSMLHLTIVAFHIFVYFGSRYTSEPNWLVGWEELPLTFAGASGSSRCPFCLDRVSMWQSILMSRCWLLRHGWTQPSIFEHSWLPGKRWLRGGSLPLSWRYDMLRLGRCCPPPSRDCRHFGESRVWQRTAPDAARDAVGSSSPSLACGPGVGCFPHQMLMGLKRGNAWPVGLLRRPVICYLWRRSGAASQLSTSALPILGVWWRPLRQVTATSASMSCLPLGASGNWATEYGGTHTWDRCLAGRLPCSMPGLGDAEHFGVGWEPGRAVKPSIIAVNHVVIQPHSFVLVASGFSAVNAHARAKILALQLVVILTAAAMADLPRGRYALEATEGSEPSWSAATAIDLAQEVVVGEFRQSRNLMRDSDFAFAFSSYEEAQAVGGQFVATAWAQVRANEMEHLIPDVASTVEASSSSAAPPRRRPAPQLKRAQGGLRLQPKKDTPENVIRRVRVFIQMGAFRPTGDLSEVLQRDWKQTVRRLAQDRVTQAETTTVLNAIRTWQELLIFLRSRNRSPPPSFLTSTPSCEMGLWHRQELCRVSSGSPTKAKPSGNWLAFRCPSILLSVRRRRLRQLW